MILSVVTTIYRLRGLQSRANNRVQSSKWSSLVMYTIIHSIQSALSSLSTLCAVVNRVALSFSLYPPSTRNKEPSEIDNQTLSFRSLELQFQTY